MSPSSTEASCDVDPETLLLNKLAVGLAKANEVLLLCKRLTAQELLECGFVKLRLRYTSPKAESYRSQILPAQSAEAFQAHVRREIYEKIVDLDPSAFLAVKRLIKQGLRDKNDADAVNLRESYEQASRIASGIPGMRFHFASKPDVPFSTTILQTGQQRNS